MQIEFRIFKSKKKIFQRVNRSWNC